MIPQDLAHLSSDELIAEVERRAFNRGYRRGYDAGRQYTHRQRKNDALRDEGVNLVRAQLAELRDQIDDMLNLSGLGAYTKTGAFRQREASQHPY